MRFTWSSSKFLKSLFLLILASSLALDMGVSVALASAQPLASNGEFDYKFVVDQDGFTFVNVTYISNSASGSSWILVPKSEDWINLTLRGEVTGYSLAETEDYTGGSFYFYEVLNFSFISDGTTFEMNLQFNFSTAAMIIEPDGVFYSPQIGFERGNNLKAEVIFPTGFSTNQGEVVAFGQASTYQPSTGSNSSYVLFNEFPSTENLIRIGIGFKSAKTTPALSTIEDGIFTFETVQRYQSYAQEILDLYNSTYEQLVQFFNVTLDHAQIQFFLPDLASLFSIGGYVPISGDEMREININIAFTRYVKGYIEVIALHELTHYFLWKAGVSPEGLLWFHEGMAQYVSMEVANNSGYEGAAMMKQDLEASVVQLKALVGNDLAFLKEWTPSNQPQDVGVLYTAAYYVVSRLAEDRGGLDYYGWFFVAMNGEKVDNNIELSYYLGLATNGSVVTDLNGWGFGITDFYDLMYYAESAIKSVNPIFQPYQYLSELLYKQALSNTAKSATQTTLYLLAAVCVATLAPLLTLFTVSAVIFGAILWALKKEGVFRD